jgi:hypothetical protein
LIPNKPRVSLTKLPHEWVSGTLDRTIPSGRPRLDLAVERAGAGVRRALTSGLGVSANQGRADRPGPAAGARVRDRVGNDWIWIRRLRLDLLWLNPDRQILDGRLRSNGQRPVMGAVALPDPSAKSRQRRGGWPRRGSRGLGKGSGAFRATWRTRPWVPRWHGSTRERETRQGGLTAAQINFDEELREH